MPDALIGGLVGFLAACALSYAVGTVVGWVVRWQDRRDREDAREQPSYYGIPLVVHPDMPKDSIIMVAPETARRIFDADVTEEERRG